MSVATSARGETGSPARTRLLLLFAALLGALLLTAGTAHAGAMLRLPGCTSNSLLGDDDGSSTTTANLGFSINFEGQTYNTAWVNNNGNITFDSALSTFTPSPIGSLGHPIVAPFWADVDTRGAGSALTTYGTTTYQGNPAFCVEWDGVGYYSSHTDKLNKFELILVSRPDRAAGDFDVIFNYDQIQWDTGDASGGTGGLAHAGGSPARVGFGLAGGGSEELSGSGTPGAFLDNGPASLVGDSENGSGPGDYVFPVLGGQPQGEPGLHGLVTSHNAALVGAAVQACPDPSAQIAASCVVTSTDGQGKYHIGGLANGLWNVTVNPPSGDPIDLPTTVGPDQIAGAAPVNQDVVMSTLTPPPTGTTVGGEGAFGNGQPALDWHAATPISTNGCAGATAAQYEIVIPAATSAGTPTVAQTGGLTEGPGGVYHGTIAPLAPARGFAQVRITLTCPAPSAPQIGSFDIYIDPAGHVVDQTGAPITGATVTLQRSDTAAGPFTQVANGSSIMAPNNRNNPSTTDSAGRFGWDTLAGFYTVTASKAGCINPTNPTLTSVTTGVLQVPPPVTDLKLTLNCDPLTNLKAVAQRDGSILVTFQATGTGAVAANATTSIRVKSKAKAKKKGKSKVKGKTAKAKKKKKSKKKAATKLKVVSYGSVKGNVPGVRVVTLKLAPSRSGKALLAQLKHLSVSLSVAFKTTPTSVATTKTATVAVRFVKPKAKKKKKHAKKKH